MLSETLSTANGLDADQYRHPNCLQMLSADDDSHCQQGKS